MTTKVQRWGNSLALRIPKSFAEDVHLAKGTVVSLSVAQGRLVVDPLPRVKYSLEKLLKKVSRKNLHPETNTGKAMGVESW